MKLILKKYTDVLGENLSEEDFIKLTLDRSLRKKIYPNLGNRMMTVLSRDLLSFISLFRGDYNLYSSDLYLRDLYKKISLICEIENDRSYRIQESILDWILLSDITSDICKISEDNNYVWESFDSIEHLVLIYGKVDSVIYLDPFRDHSELKLDIETTLNESELVSYNSGLENYSTMYNTLNYNRKDKDLLYRQTLYKTILYSEVRNKTNLSIKVRTESAFPYIDVFKNFKKYQMHIFRYDKIITGLRLDFAGYFRKRLFSKDGPKKYNFTTRYGFHLVDEESNKEGELLLSNYIPNEGSIYML